MPPKLKPSEKLNRSLKDIKEFVDEFISLEENLEKAQKELQTAINEREKANNNLKKEKKYFAKKLEEAQDKLKTTEEQLDKLRETLKDVDKLPGTKFNDKWRFVTWLSKVIAFLKINNIAASFKTVTSYIEEAIAHYIKVGGTEKFENYAFESIGKFISATSYVEGMSQEQKALRRLLRIHITRFKDKYPQSSLSIRELLRTDIDWTDPIELSVLNAFFGQEIFTELSLEAIMRDYEAICKPYLDDREKNYLKN